MMTYRSSKQSSTDQTPNMPPPQYSQSNDEEPYYILKTNNPFLFWEPLYCNVFTCVDPGYVTQTTIAVTLLHKIHYSIEVPKTKTDYWFSKYNRVLHHYSVSIEVVVAAAC
jgi:hypothetical protein